MSFLISCNLYFKVYFVWYDDCYSSFLLLPICMGYIFAFSHFQSICVLESEVGFLKTAYAAAAAKSLQSCPTLCDPHRRQPTRLPSPWILQARTLEWVAISFSNVWYWKLKVKSLSHVRLLATPWTAAYQAPPSMGFSRQGYWSGVPDIRILIADSLCCRVETNTAL